MACARRLRCEGCAREGGRARLKQPRGISHVRRMSNPTSPFSLTLLHSPSKCVPPLVRASCFNPSPPCTSSAQARMATFLKLALAFCLMAMVAAEQRKLTSGMLQDRQCHEWDHAQHQTSLKWQSTPLLACCGKNKKIAEYVWPSFPVLFQCTHTHTHMSPSSPLDVAQLSCLFLSVCVFPFFLSRASDCGTEGVLPRRVKTIRVVCTVPCALRCRRGYSPLHYRRGYWPLGPRVVIGRDGGSRVQTRWEMESELAGGSN